MKLNTPFVKAIAIITIGSSVFYAGIRFGKGPAAVAASISGITICAFGMCQIIHEFEKGDLIDHLREQAMFWEQESRRQLEVNRELLKRLNCLPDMSNEDEDNDPTTISLVISDLDFPNLQDKAQNN